MVGHNFSVKAEAVCQSPHSNRTLEQNMLLLCHHFQSQQAQCFAYSVNWHIHVETSGSKRLGIKSGVLIVRKLYFLVCTISNDTPTQYLLRTSQ